MSWHEGWTGRALTVAAILMLAWTIVVTYTRPVAPIVDPAIDFVVRSGEPECFGNWTQTGGEDPDTKHKFKVCTSPDQRYVITIRENRAPVGLDTLNGAYLSSAEIESLLR